MSRARSPHPFRRSLALAGRLGLPLYAALACSGASSAPPGQSPVERALARVERPARASELGRPPAPEPCMAPAPRAAPPAEEKPRVYAKTRFVWIRERPDWSSQWLGYLWFGESAPLRTGKPVYAWGCEAWYEVLPRGFVCVDERRATLDGNDAQYRALAARTPDYTKATPHLYAESLGSPRYAKLPTPAEVRSREPDLRAYLSLLDRIARGTVSLPMYEGADRRQATELAPELGELPAELQISRWDSTRRSALAHLGEFRQGDRSFLLTSDLAWIPVDRTRPYPPIAFHGVRLDGSVKLPLAFFRERDRRGYTRAASGHFAAEADVAFRRLTWVPLTGARATDDGIEYLETSVGHLWVRAVDAVVPTPAAAPPWHASAEAPKGRATWIETSLREGWLIAYEGTHPVYVTLASPGHGGASESAETAILKGATPVGNFSVNGKFLTATMDGPGGLSHADVPWVLNFTGPYAIHGAYWHDAWGEPVSGGCVNVSPEDGKWLFSYSEPELPPGWHGVRWSPGLEPATTVVIRN